MNDSKRANKIRGEIRQASMLCVAGAVTVVGGLTASLAPASAGAAMNSVVSTTKTAAFGTILVSGRTVYTLKPSKVACGSSCLKIWPEVLLPRGVTTTTAGPGVNPARLGTVIGRGGSRQVTYEGKRLYYFFKDTRPGQVGGNITDKWGKWSVVVTVKPAHSTSSGATPTTSTGSGGVSF